MFSRCHSLLRLLAAFLLPLAAEASEAQRELRVCADPDNLPYSHQNEEGFENRIARLLAADMGATLRYEWTPLRRGFVRKTLGEGLCDVVMGVPAEFERVLATRPYYRSSYVFVSPDATLASLQDARLPRLRIGVQLVGNDLAATPPGHALAARGLVDNVRGFTIYGDGPAAQRMVQAVANGELDAALVWGPQAGYFANRAAPPLHVRVAQAPAELAGVPFQFSIAVGVKRGNRALRDEIDRSLERRRGEIDAILARYAVPRTDVPAERLAQ
jgi:mxaJ protein